MYATVGDERIMISEGVDNNGQDKDSFPGLMEAMRGSNKVVKIPA